LFRISFDFGFSGVTFTRLTGFKEVVCVLFSSVQLCKQVGASAVFGFEEWAHEEIQVESTVAASLAKLNVEVCGIHTNRSKKKKKQSSHNMICLV
jgi:hypothetical protein